MSVGTAIIAVMPAPVDPFPNFQAGQIADADQVDARFKALYDAAALADAAQARLAFIPVIVRGRVDATQAPAKLAGTGFNAIVINLAWVDIVPYAGLDPAKTVTCLATLESDVGQVTANFDLLRGTLTVKTYGPDGVAAPRRFAFAIMEN